MHNSNPVSLSKSLLVQIPNLFFSRKTTDNEKLNKQKEKYKEELRKLTVKLDQEKTRVLQLEKKNKESEALVVKVKNEHAKKLDENDSL